MNCKVKMDALGTPCAWGTDGCITKHPNVSDRKLKWTAEQLVAIEGYKTRIYNGHRRELADARQSAYDKGFAQGQAELRRSFLSLLGLPTDAGDRLAKLVGGR